MDEGIGDSLRDYLASVGGQKTPSLVYKKTDKYFLFCLIIEVKREVGCSDEASFMAPKKEPGGDCLFFPLESLKKTLLTMRKHTLCSIIDNFFFQISLSR